MAFGSTLGEFSRANIDRESDLIRALQFIRDLATEEYGYAKIGTGAEVALRKIIQRANNALGE